MISPIRLQRSRPFLLPLAFLLTLVLGLMAPGCHQHGDNHGSATKPVAAMKLVRPQPAPASRHRFLEVAPGAGSGGLLLEPGNPVAVADSAVSYEDYAEIRERDFSDARKNPLSTFSIDVDAASYSNVRRFITAGMMPLRDAVRIEELINYFSYDYPQPTGEHPFSITTDVASCPWNPRHRLVRVGVQGRKVDMGDVPPNNLVFLIDVSGSMATPDKLPLLKSAFRLLAGQVRQQDRVAIVVYAGAAGLVLPATSGADKARIVAAIDELEAGGSTAGGEGIELAYDIAKNNFIKSGNNRVILATDGDFNVGVSSEDELVELIEEKREHGIFLSVLGFGTGNLQDSKMEQIADNGNGHYAYIDGMAEARKVFATELGATLTTIAKDVKIQVEFNSAEVRGYRLIGYENRDLLDHEFDDDTKDAGELGAGHSVTALYEVLPVNVEQGEVRFELMSNVEEERLAPFHSGEMMRVKLRYKEPTGTASRLVTQTVEDYNTSIAIAPEDFRFAAAVAEWGMLLRDSKYKGTASFDNILRLARGAQGADREGYRAEFIELVEESQEIAAERAER